MVNKGLLRKIVGIAAALFGLFMILKEQKQGYFTPVSPFVDTGGFFVNGFSKHGWWFLLALIPIIILVVVVRRKEKITTWKTISFISLIFIFIAVYTRKFPLWLLALLIVSRATRRLKGKDFWKFKKIKDKYKVVLWNKARNQLNKAINYTPWGKKVWIKRWLTPDYLQEVLKENKIILLSLSNYLKRLYIMYVKMDQVAVARNVASQMIEHIGHHTDIKDLEREIWLCRNFTPNGKAREFLEIGWFPQNKEICRTVNKINDFLRTYVLEIAAKGRDGSYSKYQTGALGLRDEITTAISRLEILHRDEKEGGTHHLGYLKDRARAYSSHQPIKAWKYLTFDQCNPYGNFEHEYKFVDKGTELSDGTKTKEKMEVNIYKEILIDKHERRKDGIRLVKDPRKIYDHENPIQVFSWVLQDWDGFIRNLRWGEFRYYSKGVFDYLAALSEKEDDPEALGRTEFGEESKIKTTPGFKTLSRPAFDRRALVNPGNMAYPGRRRFDLGLQDIQADPDKDENPALSSLGMTIFLPALVRRDINDIEGMMAYLNRFIGDTGITIESHLEARTLMGPLGEAGEKTQE